MMKVLVIDEFPQEVFKSNNLKAFEFDYRPKISAEEVEAVLPNYEGIVLRSKMRLSSEVLSKAENLKFIGRSGAGLENIDLEYAKGRGIQVFNSPEGNSNAVAEHALGMILAMMNNLVQGNSELKNGKWNRVANRGTEIADKTLAIIGCGNMGTAFAKKCAGLFKEVLVYDKYKTNYAPEGTREASLDEIYAKADVLSLHTNLSPETNYLLNSELLSKFEKNIYLINTSRGQVVNTGDLVKALKANKVLGACLDVIEYEGLRFESLSESELPEPFAYLQKAENVLMSPHVAGWTHESNVKMPSVLLKKIAEYFSLKKA